MCAIASFEKDCGKCVAKYAFEKFAIRCRYVMLNYDFFYENVARNIVCRYDVRKFS